MISRCPAVIWKANAGRVTQFNAEKVERLTTLLLEGQADRIRRNREALERRIKLKTMFERRLCPDPGVAHLTLFGSMVSGLVPARSPEELSAQKHSRYNVSTVYVADPHILRDFHSSSSKMRYYTRLFEKRLDRLRSEEGEEWSLIAPVHAPQSQGYSTIHAKFTNGCRLELQVPPNDGCFRSIRTSNLIKQYVSADPRFNLLYYWLRRVLRSFGVLAPGRQFLSCHTIALLCIHFLHTKEISPNVLPVMCEEYPELVGWEWPLQRVEQLLRAPHVPHLDGWRSENRKSVGRLAVELVHYYADFDPYNEAIYLRDGSRVKKTQIQQSYSVFPQFMIFEPHMRSPLALNYRVPEIFSSVFSFAQRCMDQGSLIDSFPYVEEAAQFRQSVQDKPWGKLIRASPSPPASTPVDSSMPPAVMEEEMEAASAHECNDHERTQVRQEDGTAEEGESAATEDEDEVAERVLSLSR